MAPKQITAKSRAVLLHKQGLGAAATRARLLAEQWSKSSASKACAIWPPTLSAREAAWLKRHTQNAAPAAQNLDEIRESADTSHSDDAIHLTAPQPNERIIVLKRVYFDMMMRGEKKLEIRALCLRQGLWLVGHGGELYGRVRFGQGFVISSLDQWRELHAQHRHPSEELPYRRTCALPVKDITPYPENSFRYLPKRGAIGVQRYRAPIEAQVVQQESLQRATIDTPSANLSEDHLERTSATTSLINPRGVCPLLHTRLPDDEHVASVDARLPPAPRRQRCTTRTRTPLTLRPSLQSSGAHETHTDSDHAVPETVASAPYDLALQASVHSLGSGDQAEDSQDTILYNESCSGISEQPIDKEKGNEERPAYQEVSGYYAFDRILNQRVHAGTYDGAIYGEIPLAKLFDKSVGAMHKLRVSNVWDYVNDFIPRHPSAFDSNIRVMETYFHKVYRTNDDLMQVDAAMLEYGFNFRHDILTMVACITQLVLTIGVNEGNKVQLQWAAAQRPQPANVDEHDILHSMQGAYRLLTDIANNALRTNLSKSGVLADLVLILAAAWDNVNGWQK